MESSELDLSYTLTLSQVTKDFILILFFAPSIKLFITLNNQNLLQGPKHC